MNIAEGLPLQGDPHDYQEVDARGLSCPLPIFNTRKSVEILKPGKVIKVLTTDRGSLSYFESLTRQTGLDLLGWHEQDGEYIFFLENRDPS